MSGSGDSIASADSVEEMLADLDLGATRILFAANSVLYDPGRPAEYLFRLVSGQVRMYQVGPDDSARLVEILGSGDWCGLGALTVSGSYICRSIAVSEVVALRVPVDRVRALLSRRPALTEELLAQLVERWQSAMESAGCLVFDNCQHRLIKTLLNFSGTAAAVPADEGGVELRITHRQLAQAVGAARETVSLALTQLRQRNLLRTGRNRLFFKPDDLRPLCDAMPR